MLKKRTTRRRSTAHRVPIRSKNSTRIMQKETAQELRPAIEKKLKALLSVPGKKTAILERNTHIVLDCLGLIDGRLKSISQAAKASGIATAHAGKILGENVQKMMQDPKIRTEIETHYTKSEIEYFVGKFRFTSSNQEKFTK